MATDPEATGAKDPGAAHAAFAGAAAPCAVMTGPACEAAMSGRPGLRARILARARTSISPASLAAFRILFGALMVVAVARMFAYGWIDEHYIQPRHKLHFLGFGWVRAWPGIGMYVHFAVTGLAALAVALGLRTRTALLLFGSAFTYAHLIDKTYYLNHYYLISCLAFMLALLPTARVASLDAWRARRRARDGGGTPSEPPPQGVPAWTLWAVRAQVGLVYVFGGVAKLKPDWLLHARPLDTWLAANGDLPLLGRFFDPAGPSPALANALAHGFAIAGALFDLSIVPLLLMRRTRRFVYLAVVVFHLTTAQLFHLGLFPWLMMAASLCFLRPSWPRRLPWVGPWFAAPDDAPAGAPDAPAPPAPPRLWRAAVPALLATHLALQVLVPLRHFGYPGDVLWTEQGFRFAWHVMLMEKDGIVDLRVRDPHTGRSWTVPATAYLTRDQARMTATQPDMILELAHIAARDFRARGVSDVEVRADAFAALNGRPRARLIDPNVDLARIHDGLLPQPWILPRPVVAFSAPAASVAARDIAP